MASGTQVSEEAGGVGCELFEVAYSNKVTRETRKCFGGGQIGLASPNQVAEDTRDVGGVGSEIGAVYAIHFTGVAGGLDGEIGVASATTASIEQAGVGGGEFRVAYVNPVTIEKVGMCGGEIEAASINHATESAGASSCEIGVASANHATEAVGASSCEIGMASANHATEGVGASSGEIGVASENHATEEAGASSDEIGVASVARLNGGMFRAVVASVSQVTEEADATGSEIQVVSDTWVNDEPAGGGCEIGPASAKEVNEPGCGKIGVPSASEVNREPGSGGGEVGVASEIQVNGEPGGGGAEVGVSSAIQVNGEPGGGGAEVGVASAFQVNGDPVGMVYEIGVASLSQINEEPQGECGDFGVPSSSHVNGISGRVGGQLWVGEKHRWVDTKVYHRRLKGEKNKGILSDLTTAPTPETFIYNGNGSQNNKIIKGNTRERNQSNRNDLVNGNGVVESEEIVSVLSTGDDADLRQFQPETVGEGILNKKFSSGIMYSATAIPVDPLVTNGVLRPLYSASDSKIKINLVSTAKLELRELKRKFESELYSVRKAVKKVDGGREDVIRDYFNPVVNSSVLPNGARSNGFATRVYSGAGSLGHVPYKPNIRPFNQLRVSVVENGHVMVDSIEREKRTPKANQFYRNSEFLLANDKFPPAESNKKSKSNGKKSSGVEFGFGLGSKVYKSCSVLLEKLMKHKHGWVFNAPVDVTCLGLHDYFLIIKNPMDLGTVKEKLIKYWYKSPMEFSEDVRLTFHNAMLYNPKGHDVHVMAETLLKIYEGKWPDIEVKYLRELRMAVESDIGYPTPTSRITNPFQSSALPHLETGVFNRSESMPRPVNPKPRTLTPAPSFRTPALKKPKAKDVDKRKMTYDEKQKLSTNLQSLPPEKLDGVIQIIKKRSTALSQNDDEIEVDIDSVDTETLWELDRYVSNYKKSLSKYRRKAELANQMRAEARQAAENIKIPQPLPPKECTSGYVNAPLSLPPHRNDPAANASGSSSSSSSSSSGSSSSDSDSDSSSEESDGGHSPGT